MGEHSGSLAVRGRRCLLQTGAVGLLLSLGQWTQAAQATCGATPDEAREASVQVQADRRVRDGKTGFHLGFNLEWTTFQRDYWDAGKGQLDPALIHAMAAFPKAVYRYPGGTVSNYLDLAASLGPASERSKQQPVSWRGPVPMYFGLAEYYDFLQAVEGTPWLVMNVYGRLGGKQDIAQLWPTWNRVADFVLTKPAPLRLELGNELYLPRYNMAAAEYAERATQAATALRAKLPKVSSVALLADFDLPGSRKRDYNRTIAQLGGTKLAEFAQHSYYDGPPGGPSVPNRLREICRTLIELRESGLPNAKLWVTEHARWPGGRTSDENWKRLWPRSNDLGAALGVADYLIGLLQIPAVQGAFLHSLAGTEGPWALMMRTPDRSLVPSAVYQSLRVLAPMFEALEVHEVRIRAPDRADYAGGYDLRATVAREPSTGHWHLFAVQRGAEPMTLSLTVPALAEQSLVADHRFISSSSMEDNNSPAAPSRIALSNDRPALRFDAAGRVSVVLPPFSVNHLVLAPQPR